MDMASIVAWLNSNATIPAWIGATTGVSAIIWQIFKELRSGARLSATARPNMISPDNGDDRYIVVTVVNKGNAPTTLTNLLVFMYENNYKKLRKKSKINAAMKQSMLEHYYLPYVLESGHRWVGLVDQQEILEYAEEAGGINLIYVAVEHSVSDKLKGIYLRLDEIKKQTES